jgi:hypothetical protein
MDVSLSHFYCIIYIYILYRSVAYTCSMHIPTGLYVKYCYGIHYIYIRCVPLTPTINIVLNGNL